MPITFRRFKEIFYSLEKGPLFSGDVLPSELDEYIKLEESDPKYSKWILNQKIKKSEVRIPKQCCLEMKYHLIEYYKEKNILISNSEYVNYDSVVIYNKKGKEYGIPIHDGGSSYIRIRFCPWCGSKLK